MQFTRATVDPAQMGGVPCIRIPRIQGTVVAMFAEGRRKPETVEAFPDLEVEDIQEALYFAGLPTRQNFLDRTLERKSSSNHTNHDIIVI
jgi:uncharacterized protein (DUF433 family)